MLQQVSWISVRNQVKQIAPQFAQVIDDIVPPEDHYLYHIEYHYGAIIVNKGVFQIPNIEKRIVPINHSTISQKIKDDLGYSGTIPLGLVTENSIEAFMCTNTRPYLLRSLR